MATENLPQHLKKDISQINADLYTATSLWLKKHGKGIKPKLSDEQREQLKECFELMDQDGSGAIDAEELGAAFKLLGIRMKRAELAALLAEVDHDGSGEVEYPEFLEIMTVTLQRLADEEDTEKNEGQVPFALMATAYRRKRLMEGIINGDKEVQAQIQQISDKANLEALQSSKQAEVEALRAKAASDAAAASSAADRAADRDRASPGGGLLGGRSPSGRPLRRIGQVDVNKALLETLGPEERRIVSSLAAKTAQGSGRAPPPPVNMLASARAYGHFAHSPAHRQLMESPQLLDLRFVHQSTIRLPPGAAGPVRSPTGASSSGGSGAVGVGGGGSGGGGGVERVREAGSFNGGSLGGMRRSASSSRPLVALGGVGGTSLSGAGSVPLPSPGRAPRSDDLLPQLRFEGGGVAYPSTKQPMGRTLGTYSGGQERVTRL